MSIELDCVIVGQGLAGSWMATALARRGWKILVMDGGKKDAASRVASGMMTPLTGKRLVPTWRLDPLMAYAKAAYRAQEAELGCSLIDERPSIRVFQSQDEVERWDKRAQDPALAPYLGERYPARAQVHDLHMPHGGCLLRGGARIRVQRWLSGVRDLLVRHGAYLEHDLDLDGISREDDGWQVHGYRAKRVVFCLGHWGATHAWTRTLAFKNARGDLIEVKAPPASEQIHLQAGVSLTALGQGRALVGGNYDWRDVHGGPNAGHRETLCTRIAAVLGHPVQVLGHRCGVRPIVEGRVPVLGELAEHAGAYVLNGLASKGTMWAPWMAQHLCEVMDGREPVDPELCLEARRARFARA